MKELAKVAAFVGAVVLLAEVYAFGAAIVNKYWISAGIINCFFAFMFLLRNPEQNSRLKFLWIVAPVLLVVVYFVPNPKLFASLTLIPIVEELAFRGLFRDFWIQYFGRFLGTYASVVFFTLAHSEITFANLLSLNFNIFLGPFLLAVACEFLVQRTKSYWQAISLHAFCNLTPVLFIYLDPQQVTWLKWLNLLYMKSDL